jgi:hypothetical protein
MTLVSVTAAPASAVASARPAAGKRMMAGTCDPSSGVRAFYSNDGSSKTNARLCAQVLQRADGSKYIQADFGADIWYKWGGLWYADCSHECTVTGSIELLRAGHSTRWSHFDWRDPGTLTGNGVQAAAAFDVYPGHYKVTAVMHRTRGYWPTQPVRANLEVEVDVP